MRRQQVVQPATTTPHQPQVWEPAGERTWKGVHPKEPTSSSLVRLSRSGPVTAARSVEHPACQCQHACGWFGGMRANSDGKSGRAGCPRVVGALPVNMHSNALQHARLVDAWWLYTQSMSGHVTAPPLCLKVGPSWPSDSDSSMATTSSGVQSDSALPAKWLMGLGCGLPSGHLR